MNENTPVSSFRPGAFYWRQIAREGSEHEVRDALHRLAKEHETLREWVRIELGTVPPCWDFAPNKSQELLDLPVTDWQKQVALDFSG